MTHEQFENQLNSMVNKLIDLTNDAAQAWMFHPENPNYVNPVIYHNSLVNEISKLKKEIEDLESDNGVL